ncbi:hypothetical protein HDV05_003996 [Chytridiales sp. JEL 0842]|nr:hypothetical protein HDV05_003996 [Chytridiales sp. JEL 0842]
MASVPHIVIIGGSFAGVYTAKALDAALGTSAKITLIEEKEAFFITFGSPRTLSDPSFAKRVWVPYTKIFSKNPENKVVQNTVKSVHEKHVILKDDTKIEFDYVCIATGSSLNSPLKSTKHTIKEGIEESNTLHNAIKAATTNGVVIVGGGSVGIELAGEIKTDLPGVKVTLIHGAGELLNNSPYITSKTKSRTLDSLKKLGVEVLLNSRVVRNEDGSILPGGSTFNLTPHTLKLESGTEITSDVQILCTGISKPNSELAASLAEGVLDEKGYIKVLKTGQVAGFKHIFALGDVSDLDIVKVGYLAYKVQSPKIVANIISLIKGPGGKLVEYTPVKENQGVIMVTTGRNTGVCQLPLVGTLGDWAARGIKILSYLLPPLDKLDHHTLYTSPHLTPKSLLLFRSLAAIYCLAVLILNLAIGPLPAPVETYLAYFTHLNYLGLIIYFTVSSINTYFYLKANCDPSFSQKQHKVFTWMQWMLYVLPGVNHYIIPLLFWLLLSGPLLRDPGSKSGWEWFNNLNMHLGDGVLMLAELFLGRTPILYTYWFSYLGVSVLYLGWVAIFHIFCSGLPDVVRDKEMYPDGPDDCWECNLSQLTNCTRYSGYRCRSPWGDSKTWRVDCDGLPASLITAWASAGTFNCWVGADGPAYCQ